MCRKMKIRNKNGKGEVGRLNFCAPYSSQHKHPRHQILPPTQPLFAKIDNTPRICSKIKSKRGEIDGKRGKRKRKVIADKRVWWVVIAS